MKKFSQIESVLDEIEFYEQRGYHKIADDLFKSFQKYAQYIANPSNDLYGGINPFFQAQVNRYACQVPECAQILCSQGGQNALFAEAFSEFADRNRGVPFTQLKLTFLSDVSQRVQEKNPLDNSEGAGNDPYYKLSKCLAALGGYGDQIDALLRNEPDTNKPNPRSFN